MSVAASPWRVTADGIALRVRVTPKSSRDFVHGTRETADGPAVQVHVRAAPSDGEANIATGLAIANWLGLPRGKVSVVGGHKSRVKFIEIRGKPNDIEKRLEHSVLAFSQLAQSELYDHDDSQNH